LTEVCLRVEKKHLLLSSSTLRIILDNPQSHLIPVKYAVLAGG